mmetsp:Transcript_23122/g.60131  ORF Transcript_23122/g.60131 Transcript_23122/m.60131 type:complete len:212 (-) Transcript_23122:181-816(-)
MPGSSDATSLLPRRGTRRMAGSAVARATMARPTTTRDESSVARRRAGVVVAARATAGFASTAKTRQPRERKSRVSSPPASPTSKTSVDDRAGHAAPYTSQPCSTQTRTASPPGPASARRRASRQLRDADTHQSGAPATSNAWSRLSVASRLRHLRPQATSFDGRENPTHHASAAHRTCAALHAKSVQATTQVPTPPSQAESCPRRDAARAC